MPIYEYKCKKCGEINEFLEGIITNEEEKICKFCGSNQLIKIPSTTNVISGRGIIGSQGGRTCCGRTERCEKPPCSGDNICKK